MKRDPELLDLLPVDLGSTVERLLRKLPPWLAKPLVGEVMGLLAPYQRHLRFRISEWDRRICVIEARNKRRLRSFRGTINAGALASLGEVSGGLLLLRNLNSVNTRYELREINAVYKKPVLRSVRAVTSLPVKTVQGWQAGLRDRSRANVRIETELFREDGELAAVVRSVWEARLK